MRLLLKSASDRRLRRMVVGIGLMVLVSFAVISLVNFRFGAIQEEGDEEPPVRFAPSAPSEPGPEFYLPPIGPSPEDAVDLVRFNVSMMTRRFSPDAIGNTETLQEVDINTQAKVEYLKGRLAASIRANYGGQLDETKFQDNLVLSPRTTIERAAVDVYLAYHIARR